MTGSIGDEQNRSVLRNLRWKDAAKKIRDAWNDLTVLNPPFPSQTDFFFFFPLHFRGKLSLGEFRRKKKNTKGTAVFLHRESLGVGIGVKRRRKKKPILMIGKCCHCCGQWMFSTCVREGSKDPRACFSSVCSTARWPKFYCCDLNSSLYHKGNTCSALQISETVSFSQQRTNISS